MMNRIFNFSHLSLILAYPVNFLILIIFFIFIFLVNKDALAFWSLLLGGSLLITGRFVSSPKVSIRFLSHRIPLTDIIALSAVLFFCFLVLAIPSQDLAVSLLFYQNGSFVGADFAKFVSDNVSRNLFYLGLIAALLSGPLALFSSNEQFKRFAGTAVLFALSQILLMLVVVHGILKPFFSRSRPRHLEDRLLNEPLEHWWIMGNECVRNCSMPSGEAAAAFACLAAALAWNRGKLWPSMVFTLVFGSIVGMIRIFGGAHFASDVVMAGVFMLPLSFLLWLAAQWLWRQCMSWSVLKT